MGVKLAAMRDPIRITIYTTQILLLAISGWVFRDAINPDGIAYIRIAGYYLEGPGDLAISGYWGPGLSLLIAAFKAVGAADLVAGRLAMGIGAVVFLAACDWFFGRAGLARRERLWSLGALALASALWSIENISPDVMVAAAMVMLVGVTLYPIRGADWGRAVWMGALGALGYYLKAVAAPFGAVAIVCLTGWRVRMGGLSRREGISLIGIAGIVMLLLTLPWVLTLSQKYERLTFSTSAAIVHATVGPGEIYRYPLGDEFEPPEPGRLTTWENPSLRPEQYWSPFESWSAAFHQARIALGNIPRMAYVQTTLFVGWIVAPALMFIRRNSGANLRNGAVGLLIAVGILQALYLPTLLPLSEQRYFFATIPWLTVATFASAGGRLKRGWALGLVAVSIVAPNIARWIALPSPEASAFTVARMYAEQIEADGLEGPVAGSGRMRRGRTGLFLAYFLERPWFGDSPKPTVEDFFSSSARWFVVRRDGELYGGMVVHPKLREFLLSETGSPAASEVAVFEVLDWRPTEGAD